MTEPKQLELFPYQDFDDYQNWTDSVAMYGGRYDSYYYPILGLVSEVGEVAAILKRTIRDDESYSRQQLVKELGDCLWYLARVAKEEDVSLSEIVAANKEKLDSRKKRNTLKGSGDDR